MYEKDKSEILEAIRSVHDAAEMHFNKIDAQLGRIGAQFGKIDAQFAAQDTKIDRLARETREGFAVVNKRLDRLERQRGSRGGGRP